MMVERALSLFERLVEALERLVEALERIADRDTKQANSLRRAPRSPVPVSDTGRVPVSDTDRATARAAARRLGLNVKDPKR